MLSTGAMIPDVELADPGGAPVRLSDVSDGWLVVQVLRYYG
ncbi:MAG: hypothetical protein ACR2QE_21490 [Acidimicrobiales bacterium]